MSGEERRDAGRVVAINQADTGDWVRYLEENTLYELHTWGYINFHCSDCKNIHFYCFAGGHIYCQWSSWLNKCYDICNITLSGTVWLEMKK